MEQFLDVGMWLAGALIVGGLLQWVKGLMPNVSSKTWAAVMPLASLVVAVSKNFETPMLIAWNAFGIWASCQLFYELIVQNVKNKFLKG